MIGIYGGTFDPVHYGHLRTALEVSAALGLKELRFTPCQIPPHRGTPGATAEQRLAMLQAALADAEPGLGIDARELQRPGPSYMVDTLASLREELGDTVPISLIIGLDACLGLPRWHRWKALFTLAHIVVMQRPGCEPEWPGELAKELAERRTEQPGYLREQPAGAMYLVTVTQLAISASQIRALIAARASARYLTPDAVLAYITRQELYRATN